MKAVDLFAGAGGFSEGAEAVGVGVVWAANHWPLAVEAHAANHPGTEHVCQDLRQADWTKLPRYDLLLASPACQGHSTASQPRRRLYHDAMRATAWAVVDCADVTEPRGIVVENVPKFREWRLYSLWRAALERLGYKLTELILPASRHGVPQRRNRLFVFGTRTAAVNVSDRAGPEPAFGPFVMWDRGVWRPIADAGAGARSRMLRARELRGARFISQHVTGHSGVPLSEPVRTITTQDQWVVVDGDRYRPFLLEEYAAAMAFRTDRAWPTASRADSIKLMGNAVPPPLAADVVAALAGVA